MRLARGDGSIFPEPLTVIIWAVRFLEDTGQYHPARGTEEILTA